MPTKTAKKTIGRKSPKPATRAGRSARAAAAKTKVESKAKPKPKPSSAKRALADLGDAERLQMFAAVEATLAEHGILDQLAELHFASDELALLCPPGQFRRTRTFKCGPGVCTESICVPIPGGGL
jgi:hypothetical protein